LLRALRDGDAVRAPDFDRRREEPVPEAIPVPPDAALVITEGNYLLLEQEPWSGIRSILDEVWFVTVPEEIRIARLVERHVQFGRSRDEAWRRATAGSDAANARLVEATRQRADVIVDAAELPA
jgi:pantothenate kinase